MSRRRQGGPGFPSSVVLAGLVALVLGSCGLASRRALLQFDLQRGQQSEAGVAELRGAEPTAAVLWAAGAEHAASAERVEDALALLEQGLRFLPGDLGLASARAEVLGWLNRPEARVEALDQALGSLAPAPFEAALRANRVATLLELGRIEDAEREVRRLGGVIGRNPALVSAAWSSVALAYEMRGQSPQADASLEESLASGPTGVTTLLGEVAQHPERGAALRSLASRASERHPRHPDLALVAAVDALRRGDLDELAARIAALPDPLPPRLVGYAWGLQAQSALLQGDIEESVRMVERRLAQHPTDAPALTILLEGWRRHGQPSAETTERHLLRARRHTTNPAVLRELDAALAAVTAARARPLADPPPDG